jgi:predicted RNA binding protein YcfA (HicA-like mRNA interferase family)
VELTSNKELKKILREAELRGWAFERKSGRHIKGKHVDGVTSTTISVSPSDHHAIQNIKRDLKKGSK